MRRGVGTDKRIGKAFLYAGTGYGGSCFPKDVLALIQTADDMGVDLTLLKAVHEANERQKSVLLRKIRRVFGEDLSGRRFALWGLAFKPETDDMRAAPSLRIVQGLLEAGASVAAHDSSSRTRKDFISASRREHYFAERSTALMSLLLRA